MPETPASARSKRLKEVARSIGFDLCGIAPAFPVPHPDTFEAWLAQGFQGEMTHLAKRREDRLDPARLLPGVQSVVCVALSYRPSTEDWPLVGDHPIACYAWGKDYHLLLHQKLEFLANTLVSEVPGSNVKCYTDTGPVMEKSYARRAGLGWLGKNSTLLNERLGSFLFLGEILTDVQLEPDSPELPDQDRCGSCSICMEACPTGALVRPGVLDARRCVSYLTLEHKSAIPADLTPLLSGYIAGCDLCQACCPHNASAPPSREKAFQPDATMRGLTLEKAASMTQAEFNDLTRDRALDRLKFRVWRRNIQENLAAQTTGAVEPNP